jgi:RNA polymerase sigma-70 factor (ECF subfamily)
MCETSPTLLGRVRDRADGAAWEQFAAIYRPLIMGYARGLGLGTSDADDVAQSVFVRLVEVMPGFVLDRSRGRFRTWLWRLVYNEIAGRARRDRRYARALEELARRLGGVPVDDQASDPDWDEQHRLRLLKYALDQVKARTRHRTWACFDGHIIRQRPSAEVGAALGLTAGAVDVNCTRVLRRLRDFVREHLEDLNDGDDILPP